MNLSRRLLLGGLLATPAARLWAEAPETSIRPRSRHPEFRKVTIPDADALVEKARLTGKVSFAVADTRTGEILESRAPLLPQPPASTAKTLSSLYALDTLGADYTFKTRLLATGPVTNGRIEGDLILAGGGDPDLDTDALGEMAAELKRIGVREVAGRFRVWSGALPEVREIDPLQPDHLAYNPSVGGLNLNYNRVHFEWRRSGGAYDVAMDARSAKYSPGVTVAKMSVADRAGPVYTYTEKDDTDIWTVAKGALGGGGSRWLPVRRPDLYAGEVFQTLARAHGIQTGGRVAVADTAEGSELVVHESAPLSHVLTEMLKYSTNLTAEVVGMTATTARSGGVRDLVSSARSMDAWLAQQAGASSAQLVDHSGLGGESRIDAADMVAALIKLGPQEGLRPLLKTYEVEDSPDALVQAKTGTLNFVSALVGYVRAQGGHDLAFAIYCADVERRDALSEAEMEQPPGGSVWLARARTLQRALLSRWSTVYAA
ncbi:D-alanyl-D-alanine carboxypeptidase/D-alanyl-D-alanine endopeptidase [Oceaniglobus roseus]|uniref:D-alanyl-D-alanine carboxypeptidase/D-alanyl-D-alanine endopeptidase n=1 Tax=Oceaniglobus roseus TaxID=1737570 RepID=UPI001FE4967A|nr:D-alanyl-D-alanine carboxypeptidase/D-alanyl-D-alanine-endopeptidase [Kandeliimicrobium roseum]